MNQVSGTDLLSAADELAEVDDPAFRSHAVEPRAKPDEGGQRPRHLETVMQIPVSVKIVLGSATMPVANVLRLGRGAVVPLDRKVGEPVDVVVNGRVIARREGGGLDEER